MDSPEIILNLWYVYDELGMIYSLRGRCYIASGNDEEKLEFLRKFAESDYPIAQPFPVPERLHTTLKDKDGERKLSVVPARIVNDMGSAEILFEEVYVELEKQLPAQTHLTIGRKPLICITPLLATENGGLKPMTSRPVRLGDLRTSAADQGTGNPKSSATAAGEQLVMAAMATQTGQIPLEDDTTYRLRPSARDYLLWIRCANALCNPPEFVIADFWEFREGDRLLITNREEDYPAAVEQMEEGGPSLWKALPGDRLAWVGWRPQSNERKPTLIALINCFREGYVYGEAASPTLDSVMSFGTATSEATPEIRNLWMVGYDAALALGLPRTWTPPATNA